LLIKETAAMYCAKELFLAENVFLHTNMHDSGMAAKPSWTEANLTVLVFTAIGAPRVENYETSPHSVKIRWFSQPFAIGYRANVSIMDYNL